MWGFFVNVFLVLFLWILFNILLDIVWIFYVCVLYDEGVYLVVFIMVFIVFFVIGCLVNFCIFFCDVVNFVKFIVIFFYLVC